MFVIIRHAGENVNFDTATNNIVNGCFKMLEGSVENKRNK